MKGIAYDMTRSKGDLSGEPSSTKRPDRLIVNGNSFDVTAPDGRFAARAIAFWIMPDDPKQAEQILSVVGREG